MTLFLGLERVSFHVWGGGRSKSAPSLFEKIVLGWPESGFLNSFRGERFAR